ncbi:asparagine synthetase B family protein [Roseibium album]|uniref:asparagine synthetase B family protein n=1 Tax=Roseibium album TaxID=311410 RepID=UPI0032EE31C4
MPLTVQGAMTAAQRAGRFDDLLIAVKGLPKIDGPADAISLEELVQRFREEGPGMLAGLQGAFSLAIVDLSRQRTMLAVDRMGIGRLAYAAEGSRIVFADRVDRLARCPGISAELSQQSLHDFLFFHMIPSPGSVFSGINKIEPASYVTFCEGRLQSGTYWAPKFHPDRTRSIAQLGESLRDALEHSVRATDPGPATGAFLSGGLDSSTVAAYLGKATGAPARTYSIGFDEPGYDELPFARIANQHFRCRGHEYRVTSADVIDLFPSIAKAYDEPFGNSSALPALLCARLAAEDGVTHLLAGDGGDELFAGNERYAKQLVFEKYQSIPRILRTRLIEPAARFLRTWPSVPPLRKLCSYIDQARIPLPERLETWNIVYREGVKTMLDPDFAANVDLNAPIQQMHGVYHRAVADDTLDRLLAFDWHFTLADSDLRKVSRMCELAGVRVSYPMLDNRLVDLAMEIPPEVKMRNGNLRSFYKQALQEILPDAILKKSKHGFGLPVGKWLKAEPRLAELIYSRLQSLKNRRILQNRFIDDLIAHQRAGHHAYYGFFLWDLAILEEWLAEQERTTG